MLGIGWEWPGKGSLKLGLILKSKQQAERRGEWDEPLSYQLLSLPSSTHTPISQRGGGGE